MYHGLHMLGAVDVPAAVKPDPSSTQRDTTRRDSWIVVVSTLFGGVLGSYLWKAHPILGLLDGFAVGSNLSRLAIREIPVRRAAENLGSHAVATAGSLALPRYALIGYLAGAAGSNLFFRRSDTFLERLDETVLGRKTRAFLSDKSTVGDVV